MDYAELNLTAADEAEAEILTAELADYPFESFTYDGGVLRAYIPTQHLAGCKEQVDALLDGRGKHRRGYITIEDRDWNAQWERNFTPVDVDGRLLIRAPFHQPAPEGVAEVVVTPRMAFGTGHHATTRLMARALLDRPLEGLRVLDVGCGTGVLAILALRSGALRAEAVDIDEWSVRNSLENGAENGVADRLEVYAGDVSRVARRRYDLVLANINRNVLLHDMAAYADALDASGVLLLSGFLEQDIPTIEGEALRHGLRPRARRLEEGWAQVECVKEEAVG